MHFCTLTIQPFKYSVKSYTMNKQLHNIPSGLHSVRKLSGIGYLRTIWYNTQTTHFYLQDEIRKYQRDLLLISKRTINGTVNIHSTSWKKLFIDPNIYGRGSQISTLPLPLKFSVFCSGPQLKSMHPAERSWIVLITQNCITVWNNCVIPEEVGFITSAQLTPRRPEKRKFIRRVLLVCTYFWKAYAMCRHPKKTVVQFYNKVSRNVCVHENYCKL